MTLKELRILRELTLTAIRARYNPSHKTMLDTGNWTRDELRVLEAKIIQLIESTDEWKAEHDIVR